MQAIRSCVESEDEAQIIVSTAHKAKGCEWDIVQIDRDFDAAFTTPDRPEEPGITKRDLNAEGRLFYVAMTRGKSAVELPPGAMLFFGITNSRSEQFGTPYVPRVARAAVAAANRFSQTRPPSVQTTRQPSLKSDPVQPQSEGAISKFLKALLGK